MVSWSFLTRRARVLLCIARDPGVRLRDIAASVGITERSVTDSPRSRGARTTARTSSSTAGGRPPRRPRAWTARSPVESPLADQVAFHLCGHRSHHEQHLVGDGGPVGAVQPGADAGEDLQGGAAVVQQVRISERIEAAGGYWRGLPGRVAAGAGRAGTGVGTGLSPAPRECRSVLWPARGWSGRISLPP
jgi:hypothetical protein